MAAPKPSHLMTLAAAGVAAFWAAARLSPAGDASAQVVEAIGPRAAASAPVAATPAMTTAAPRPAIAAASAASAAYVLGQRQQAIPDTPGEAFAVLSWLPPPPPPPPPPRPPAPTPPAPPALPPLPFGFVGMVEEGAGKPQAFLAKGDALLIVSPGDVIENNTYRVETLSPGSVVLTYLPMGKQQTLNVSGTPP